jgi:hypothetical protein
LLVALASSSVGVHRIAEGVNLACVQHPAMLCRIGGQKRKGCVGGN